VAELIAEYSKKAELKSGPLFRARKHRRLIEPSEKQIGAMAMYNILPKYLPRLPGSMRELEVTSKDGEKKKVSRCVYTPHLLRATTGALLLDAGVDIIKVNELLGHRHVTTTQTYDKRRRATKEGASHGVPI
jgi:integrase